MNVFILRAVKIQMLNSKNTSGAIEKDAFTQRELEVLTKTAYGYSYREIASQLSLTQGTVQTATSSVIRKLDARNRIHATALAVSMGIISIKPDNSQSPLEAVFNKNG